MKSILLMMVLAGCSDTHCDRDQKYRDGLCYEPVSDAGPASPDAGFAHYGDTCVDPSACAAPANFCFITIDTDTGYCTRSGCAIDADCPSGWQCTDLSVFLPGEPAVCTKSD